MTRGLGLTRRSFSAGLTAAAALGSCPICRAQARQAPRILCASAAQGIPQPETLLDTSGDRNLDGILAAEMTEQSRFFGLRPAFRLYKTGAENAVAIDQTDLPGTQGTILYHVGFMQGQLKSSQWGGAVVAGIIAHEFSHIFQFYTDYGPRLEALHKTVKFQELHADYISAFYMAKKYVASKVKLDDYFDEFYKQGDYNFNNKDHHGTKEERYFAVKSGHNLSLINKNGDIAFAAAQGEALLKEYFR
jgi:hypothetical protein